MLRLCALLLILTLCESARILLINPTPSYSHQIIFQPIWRELAQRGHDMVVITTDPIRDPSIPNLKEIDLSFAYDIWKSNLKDITNNADDVFNNIFLIVDNMYNILERELMHPEVQGLIKNKTEHFDLVMIEYMFPTMFAFKERFKCPFIGISSMEIGGRGHEFIGNPRHSVAYPEVLFGFPEKLNLLQRMVGLFAIYGFELYWDYYYAPRDRALVEKYFGKGYSSNADLYKSVDMVFVNSNPVFNKIRPVSPATVMISGGIHIKEERPLPEDLQTYFNNSRNGIIYFSLGSNVKSKDIPTETKNIFIKVLSELPYDVLWKYEDEELPGKPKNVKIMKWAPQQDILRHPKVKLFITQAGMQSLEEALFSHVPLVAIPFFGDQSYNAKKVEDKGLGLIIENHKTMTPDDLKNKILEVINNPKYKNRVKELAELVRDEPMNALEKAVWWTEYVLRHGGAQHLKAKTIPYYQFYYLDVMSVVLAVIMSIYFIVKKCIQCICCKKMKKD